MQSHHPSTPSAGLVTNLSPDSVWNCWFCFPVTERSSTRLPRWQLAPSIDLGLTPALVFRYHNSSHSKNIYAFWRRKFYGFQLSHLEHFTSDALLNINLRRYSSRWSEEASAPSEVVILGALEIALCTYMIDDDDDDQWSMIDDDDWWLIVDDDDWWLIDDDDWWLIVDDDDWWLMVDCWWWWWWLMIDCWWWWLMIDWWWWLMIDDWLLMMMMMMMIDDWLMMIDWWWLIDDDWLMSDCWWWWWWLMMMIDADDDDWWWWWW